MIRTLILLIDLFVTTTLAFLILIVFGLINPYGRVSQAVFYYWSLMIIKLSGVKIEISGLENYDRSKGYIVAANHKHLYDIPIICVASKLNIRFAAKVELFKIPIFGIAMQLAGMVKIDRGNNQKALDALKQAESAIKQGVSLVIFPEGTRNKGSEQMLPFKKGAFMMSINTGQDLLPVTVNRSNTILQGISVKPKTVSIHFHPPVSPKTNMKKRDQFMKDVREIIA
ncbi:MAG: 1-acyl-sn-glycerol-3-phosphate acyltransferase, partial [Calditrichaeota bacterium]|nr:1-acyl-sn-glycerol-3-phosphate acyltransferase [Calditrichota bacterium]